MSRECTVDYTNRPANNTMVTYRSLIQMTCKFFYNERPHTDKIDLIATAVEFKNLNSF